jgi:hypothetical protein
MFKVSRLTRCAVLSSLAPALWARRTPARRFRITRSPKKFGGMTAHLLDLPFNRQEITLNNKLRARAGMSGGALAHLKLPV